MLGLGDQVGRHERRVGAESSARMPISVGPASESIPMTPLSSRLADGDVDVAGAGDEVDPLAVRRCRTRTSPPPGPRRPRGPRRRRAARRRPAPPGAAARRARAAAGWPRRASRRPPPGPARRSSRRWTGTPPGRPGTYSPTRRTGSQRSVTRPPGATSTTASSAGLRLVHQPGAADRLLDGGPHLRVERGQGRVERLRRAPASRPAAPRRTARWRPGRRPTPRCRTSSQTGRTASSAASTSSAARGSTSRGSDLGPAQVDAADHAAQSRRPGMPAPPRARTVEGWPSAR